MSNFEDLGGLSREQEVENYVQRRQAGWESSAVLKVLKALGLIERKRDIERAGRERTGTGHLGLLFPDFHAVISTFPVRLAARRIPYLHNDPSLWKAFTKSRLYQAWEESRSVEGEEGVPFALVFPWSASAFPWNSVTTMVLHDWGIRGGRDDICLVRRHLIIEPLVQFLEAITRDGWEGM